MADEYDPTVGGTNWWDLSTRTATSSSAATVSTSCSSVVFPLDIAAHPNSLQIMGLGLSSQPVDQWNHHLLPLVRGSDDKAGEMSGGFRSMLQEGAAFGSTTQKLFTGDEAAPEFKPIKGFSLDQFSHGSSSVDSCSHGLPSPTFLNPAESSSSVYANPPVSGILQGLMASSDQHQHQHQQSAVYGYHYGMQPSNSHSLMSSTNWPSNKVDQVPQFLKGSMVDPKPIQAQAANHNLGSFWNMAAATAMGDPRPATFFPLQMVMPSFDENPKHNMMEARSTSGAGRKTGLDQTTTGAATSTSSANVKRSRNEASSTIPPFKVRKEKMGDRITALQQLVSPFGKTDTASVLSEAIEYIKFLHEQVNALSTPYLKSGASLQHQQSSDKSKDIEEPRQDLRSRGLCLVPVSSTFPVAQETTVDFWTPTFGGTFR